MYDVPQISVDEAKEKFDTGSTIFVDIRDAESYRVARIPGAMNLNNDNVHDFVDETDKANAIIVYCYHGNSSLGGTAFFMEHGFENVHSMAGGFDAWRLAHEFEAG